MAKVYVTMTAGKTRHHILKLVFECSDNEALIVEQNARANNYAFVNIATRKPYYSGRYFPSYNTKKTHPEWYKLGLKLKNATDKAE